MHGMPLLAVTARQRQRERLRVILPRICRTSRPADNCHSNKYPLWVSAIDENARSLRPQRNGWKRCLRGCEGCSGRVQDSLCDRSRALRGNAARDAPRPFQMPNAERPLRHSHAERGNDLKHFALPSQNHRGSGLAREGGVSGAAELSWLWPTTNPPPSGYARAACHAHTASRRFRRHESAAPTAACRSGHGWPGRSPAYKCRPCSVHQ